MPSLASASLTEIDTATRSPEEAHQQLLEELDSLSWLLDSRWRLPGTGLRFGVDGVAGLVPGVGDVATGLVSAWLVWRAASFSVPAHLLARMVGNVVLDSLVGAIPIVGSLFDFAFKANRRNVALLRRHLARRATTVR